MTCQRVQQAFLIHAQRFSIPEQAERSQPLIVTRGNPHKRYRSRLFRERPACANLLGHRSSFHFALTLPSARNQPTHAGFRRYAWSRPGLKFPFPSPPNPHPPPTCIPPYPPPPTQRVL